MTAPSFPPAATTGLSARANTLILTLLVSMNIGNTKPSGPFLFFAMNILPVFAFLSLIVLEIEQIKSDTKHLLNASEIDSIVTTSAFNPVLFV